MTTIVTATVSGTTYNLTDGSLTWRMLDENLATPPIRRLEERGPLQHGTTDVGFRLDPRFFTLTLLIPTSDAATMYNSRKSLLNIFKPLSSTAIQLQYILDNGDTRQIDCYLSSEGLQMGAGSRQGRFGQLVAVGLKANDPTWYDPALVTVNYGITAGSGAFNVPMSVPTGVGSSIINQTQSIIYSGNWQSNPVVKLQGPLTNPVITNLTTGEKLDFTGAVLSGTDIYTIDTRYGYKTVLDQNGANKISSLSNDSNLATFHLETDPIAPGGSNNIKITGSGASSGTQAYLQYYKRYIGI